MKKVVIIGCPGAGKSTFGRKLAGATGLPLHYLDMLYHRPDRTTADPEEFDIRLEEILLEDKWIVDGNYLRTLSWRLEYADTVFFFDLPLEVCLAGATERLGKDRPDMPWADTDLDPSFREWIVNFPEFQLPVIRLLLDSFDGTIVRFTTREEADMYIATL